MERFRVEYMINGVSDEKYIISHDQFSLFNDIFCLLSVDDNDTLDIISIHNIKYDGIAHKHFNQLVYDEGYKHGMDFSQAILVNPYYGTDAEESWQRGYDNAKIMKL